MKTTPILLLCSALLLAACGQTTTPASPPATVSATRVTVTVKIPRAPSPAALRPQYVPSTTTSLRIRIGGSDQTVPVTPDSSNCTTTEDGTTCTFTIKLSVAAGDNLTLTVDALDSQLTVLATASETVTVKLGQDNPLAITLVGVIDSAGVTFTDRAADITSTPGVTDLDRGGTYAVSLALKDPSGQLIVGPGRPNVLLCSSDAAFVVTASGPNGHFTLNAPEPLGTDQSTTLSAVQGADCQSGTTLTSGTVTVPAEQLSLSLGSSSVVAGSPLTATLTLKTARGNALPVAGRSVVFTTSNGTVISPVPTGSAGTASTTVSTSPTVGVGTLTASVDGLSTSATFSTVAGTPTNVTSSLVFTPDTVKVQGQSTLTLTLKDANGNPVTATPTITAPGGATVTPNAASSHDNVYVYDVTAPATPGTYGFDASVNGAAVGHADLVVQAYSLTVSLGATPITAGSRYDFSSGAAQVFTVAESSYAGAFHVTSSNPGVVAASLSGGSLTLTPSGAAGLSTITVTDDNGQSFAFDVSVTTVTITIN